MRIVRDPHICSAYQLMNLGEAIAESHAYHPPYGNASPGATSLDEFKMQCKKAVLKCEEGSYERYNSPRCGSVIFATTIEHQPIATKHLLDLGFTGTGFITFGKYIHSLQFFTMPLPLFIPAIGLAYFTRGDNED